MTKPNATPPRQGNAPGARTPAATPIGPVLAFTFLNSLGTGAVQTGVFFLLQSAFGFGKQQNYVFGLVLYGSYIAGALAAGPLLRRLARALPWLSTRGVLLGVLAGQALASFLPRAAKVATDATAPPEWTMWAVAVAFGVLTGVMWPIVESYLSGGRSGRRLSSATGLFNILWSASVLASFWLMAPLLESSPLDVITALGLVQLASAILLRWFAREPARHVEHEHEPHPPHWSRLLAAFRVLLPLSYVVSGTLSPLLPAMLADVGVLGTWGPPIASAWLTSRVLVFAVFERWSGWHGSRAMPLVAGLLLIGGFAGAVLAPRLGGTGAGLRPDLAVLVASLAVFGAGHAMIYLGALYYAMEVGKAEVDAGGTHEALIGLGYGLGPAIGLAILMTAGDNGTGRGSFDAWLIAAVIALSVLAGVLAVVSMRSSETTTARTDRSGGIP